ncbi:YjbE family putative metal transport protein [Pelotomaculum terephthalicicum JT]|uniref:TerC family protein n=1 Tax=Pelotomaculum TaxID=191373 RepID=UPI0009C9D577|nr:MULTISPECIES: TerC family protein [Pelotomaculum]MCG9967064.1 YjbE family putative metal transport protein [Pelotomaculum terephthalicicum JT]OPX89251.1 MAG: Integral membrane protein TerC family protein [Pelotomaculum sp. PtaB.Bin117]OPY63890.1 MAG: Integral membrane protein TerC family protein [Pelotomaculum sp. PtaU1.Bin065]
MELFGDFTLMISLLQIIVIDLILSGDNAVVIGMATRNLDIRSRKKAVILGAAAAILLRVFFTCIAAVSLVQIPLLQLFGGLMLIWIAVKLLVEKDVDCTVVSPQRNLFRAIKTIVLADMIMSLDNILGVAGASHGNLFLLLLGLLFSMPLLMTGSQVLAGLMSRFSWITYVGGIIIAWVAGEMIYGERLIINLLPPAYFSMFIPAFSVIAVLIMSRAIKSRQ